MQELNGDRVVAPVPADLVLLSIIAGHCSNTVLQASQDHQGRGERILSSVVGTWNLVLTYTVDYDAFNTHKYIHTYRYINICTYKYIYKYIYIYIYINIYIYI